jgi:hypothetical protein
MCLYFALNYLLLRLGNHIDTVENIEYIKNLCETLWPCASVVQKKPQEKTQRL